MTPVLDSPPSISRLGSVEDLILCYHWQLQKWARVLTGGDAGSAEELVQELCLHLCLTQPDLDRIERLDGYLYTALRHLHLSRAMRLARERQRMVAVENYDTFPSALNDRRRDMLDIQNELLRICSYGVWRQQRTKSGSLFMLHFFHGYHRKEVAALARIPLAAVYNGIKDIRSELHTHLHPTGWSRFRKRQEPPQIPPLTIAEPEDTFLRRLRRVVFQKRTQCLPEDEWHSRYLGANASPICLSELAHLSGCATCLQIVEQVLDMNDHEGPLDGVTAMSPLEAKRLSSVQQTIRSVERRARAVQEHRPAYLDLAVNGGLVKTRSVEHGRISFSYRAKRWADAEFVELFDELGNRLVYIAFEPGKEIDLKQRVRLSDHRFLTVAIRVSNSMLHAEAAYEDPVLLSERGSFEPRKMLLTPVYGWIASAALVALLCTVVVRRPGSVSRPAADVAAILARSSAITGHPTPNEAFHRTIAIEEITGIGNSVFLGSVDAWIDNQHGDRRLLSDPHARKLAYVTVTPKGEKTLNRLPEAGLSDSEWSLIASEVWQSDVSAQDLGGGKQVEAERRADGYELTSGGQARGAVGTRTLRLNKKFEVVEERASMPVNGKTHHYRLVQTSFERVPTSHFPAKNDLSWRSERRNTPSLSATVPFQGTADANLEVAVLFALFQLRLDVGQPLLMRTGDDGRVVLEGSANDAAVLHALRARLSSELLTNRVDLRIQSSSEASRRPLIARRREPIEVLTTKQEEPVGRAAIRTWLSAQGKSGSELLVSEAALAGQIQIHAELLLQHAFALQRLSGVLSEERGRDLTPNSKGRWAMMASGHTTAAVTEMATLRQMLARLTPAISTEDNQISISASSSFERSTTDLLYKAQRFHAAAVALFGTGVVDRNPRGVDSVEELLKTLPLSQGSALAAFTQNMRLTSQEPAEARTRRAE